MADIEPGALADSIKKSTGSYDDDTQMIAFIAADLRRRGAAGIRFWPSPQSTVGAPASARSREAGTTTDIAQLIEDEIPW